MTVEDFTCTPRLADALGTLGYTQVPEIFRDHLPPLYQGPETDWEKRYFRPPANQRPTHLHVRALGRPNQRYPILFRDYLRTHPIASTAYAQIKVNLSRCEPDDIEFYYDSDTPRPVLRDGLLSNINGVACPRRDLLHEQWLSR